MGRIPFAVLALTTLGLFACQPPDDEPTPTTTDPIPGEATMTTDVHPLLLDDLELPAPVERPLDSGETHTYALPLEAEHYLRLTVDQRGVDVVLRLLAPDGARLLSVDSPTGARGAEVLTYVTPASGEYRLEVAAYEGEVKAGHYELEVEELRPATQEDKHRVGAALAFQAGEELRREATADSRRRALAKYGEALESWRALGDPTEEARTLYRIGWIHNELEELLPARDAYREARRLFHELGDGRREGVVLNLLGTVEMELEELGSARQTFDEALRLFGEIGRPALEASAFFNIGNLHLRRNEVQKALDANRAGLERARAAEDEVGQARAHHNIGTALLYQGQLEKALDELHQALEMRRGQGNRNQLAGTLNRLGDAYQRLGRLGEALGHLEEALELRRADGNPRSLAMALNSLGNLYLKMEHRSEAGERFREALELVRGLGRRHDEAVLLVNLAQNPSETDAGSLALSEQAIALFQLTGDVRGEAFARYTSAKILHDLKAYTAARAHLEDAVAKVEELRPELEQEGLQMAFFANKQSFYELLVDVSMHLAEQVPEPAAGYDALALEVDERRRARVLLDLLSEARAGVRRGVDARLLAREAEIRDALNAAQRAVLLARRGGASAAALAERERRQRELLGQLEDVRREIRNESPRYAALTRPEPLTLKGIRRLLDPDTLMLFYSLGEERSFLWCVSRRGLSSHVLPGRAEIESLVIHVVQRWARKGLRPPSMATEAASRLSLTLLGPVADQLGDRRLAIVGSGVLQYLPFAALPDPAAPAPREGPGKDDAVPLVAAHEIVYLPSATVLATLRREVFDREPAPFDVALIADPVFQRDDPRVDSGGQPSEEAAAEEGLLQRAAEQMGLGEFERLPGTRAEAEAIGSLVPEDLRLEAFDFEASRASVLAGDLDRYKILHFATHSFLNARYPELSGLVLSLVDEAARPQDGFLRLHEIYNLDLPAELVVLSACETALGAEVAGEGLVGLTRGFMYAGAPRVVVSLWKVSDESTAELMRRFYSGIFEQDLSPAAALRSAQLSLRREERWRHPFYWAPFVLQGEWLLESPPGSDADSDIEPEQGGGQDAEPMDSDIGVPTAPPGGAYNGVNGATGEYLPPPPSSEHILARAEDFVLHPARARERRWIAESFTAGTDRLPGYGTDPRDLASAGWGVVFAPDVGEEVREALKPLLHHRRDEAGSRFKVYDYQGETREAFLSGHNVGFGPVDPKKVPYYLLLVGDPRTLPFRFQYELDMQFAVGRIHFESVEEYRHYAEGVVRAETEVVRRPRRVVFFAAENPDDDATHRMRKDLVEPLAKALAEDRPDWEEQLVLGEDATKGRLARLLGGEETPALLFTTTHGMGFPCPHPRLHSDQGALLCQDWPGPKAWSGEIPPDHYFAAADVPEDADLHGLVAFHFACYSAGTPEQDSYFREKRGRPERRAEHPFVSRLCQRLLGHPGGGALAVLGHVDRAWTTSFSWTGGESGETEVFESTLKPLLDGHRVGFATEYLNQRYAELSVHLSNLLEDREDRDRRLDLSKSRLDRVFRANNDARNFVLVGDPAVRTAAT